MRNYTDDECYEERIVIVSIQTPAVLINDKKSIEWNTRTHTKVIE